MVDDPGGWPRAVGSRDTRAALTAGSTRPGTTIVRMDSPVGTLTVEGSERGIRCIRLPARGHQATAEPPRVRPPAGSEGTGAPGGADAARLPRPLVVARAQLEEYFAGHRHAFDVPLELAGTPFQQQVWRALQAIPYGTTVTYRQLASMIGRPGASRAVGQANGANPAPIIVPCHRVTAAGGRIGGYRGGTALKRRLLAVEGVTGL